MNSSKKNRLFLFVICIFAAVFLSSCFRDKTIKFDESDPLSLNPDCEWAVISEPYAAFRKDCNYESPVVNHARRGEILQIKGRSYVTESGEKNEKIISTWYYFDEGWLESSLVEVYSNKFKAQSAAEKLLK